MSLTCLIMNLGASEMLRLAKALAAKPEDPSVIPGTPMAEG